MSIAMQRAATRRQIRAFVLIWTFITFVMGLATFVAIYFTYGSLVNDNGGSTLNVALPNPTGQSDDTGSVVVIASNTPAPTHTPEAVEPTTEPTTEITQVAAQSDPAATATDAPPPTPTPTLLPVDEKQFQPGIQVQYSLDYNPDNQDGYYRSVANDLGLGWVKQQVRWELMEPEPGNYNWGILDLTMTSAEKFGLKKMLSIVTAPEWAREQGADLSTHGPPANYQDYVNFVLAILERYPGQVHAIEVWNEQNLSREWTSSKGLRAEDYTVLLRDTYNAVKAVDPGIIIISGALSPTGISDGVGAWDDFTYTEQLIQAGALEYADCYGAHHNGYNIGPSVRWNEVINDPTALFRGPFDNGHHSWSFRSTLEGYNERIKAAGYSTPLCVTEFGWAVAEDIGGYPAGFEFAADNTLAEQAEWIPEALTNMEDWGFVWLAFVWNFNYGPQAGYNPDNDNVPYSLIGPDYTFRPAYDAIREWQTAHLERTGQ